MIYIVDTSIVSLLLRPDRNPSITRRYEREVASDAVFVVCPLVSYEARRGLMHLGGQRQLRRFDRLTELWTWNDLQAEDWHVASSLWVQTRREGRQPGDADLLIAAHATRLGATVVTRKRRDFEGLGLALQDWASP